MAMEMRTLVRCIRRTAPAQTPMLQTAPLLQLRPSLIPNLTTAASSSNPLSRQSYYNYYSTQSSPSDSSSSATSAKDTQPGSEPETNNQNNPAATDNSENTTTTNTSPNPDASSQQKVSDAENILNDLEIGIANKPPKATAATERVKEAASTPTNLLNITSDLFQKDKEGSAEDSEAARELRRSRTEALARSREISTVRALNSRFTRMNILKEAGQKQQKPGSDMKLGPSLGRQVDVDPARNVDLSSALRNLGIKCAQNNVRGQSNNQRFHVRKGQVRKNLRMIRWRRLFKFSFRHTVSKIQRMRNQGW